MRLRHIPIFIQDRKAVVENRRMFLRTGNLYAGYSIEGEVAERQRIFIMRAFREMWHYIQQNQQFVTKDVEKRVYAIDAIENTTLDHPIIDVLFLNPGKII